MVTYAIMLAAASQLSKEYADTIVKVTAEWRQHAIPECDALAIS